MAGADTIFKLVGGTLVLVILIFVVGVGFTLVDPIYNQVLDKTLMSDHGWGDPGAVALLFMGLSLIGIGLVVIVWWIASPIRDDVRQDTQPPL